MRPRAEIQAAWPVPGFQGKDTEELRLILEVALDLRDIAQRIADGLKLKDKK